MTTSFPAVQVFSFLRRPVLCLELCAALGHTLPASALQADNGPYTIRLKLKQGEISKYQTNISISLIGGLPGRPQTGKPAPNSAIPIQQMSVLQQHKVTKASPNGGGEVSITTLSLQGNAAGQPLSAPSNSKPLFMTFDAHGKTLAIRGMPTNSVGSSMLTSAFGSGAMGSQGTPLPDKPIRVGDTWSQPMTVANVGTGQVKGKFVKVETVGAHKTALLHYVVTVPIKTMMNAAMQPTSNAAQASTFMTGTATMNFDNNIALVDGKIIRSSGSGTAMMGIKPKTQKPGSVNSKMPPGMQSIKLNLQIAIGSNLVE